MERSRLIRKMESIVGAEGVVHEHEQLRTYECDGLMNYRVIPDLVVLPETGEHVQKVVKLCYDEGIPFVARGSGTGLSGGALPVESGVLIVLSRMRKILEVDIPNQRIVVEPGVVNMWVSQEVADQGYYYAPDPASQIVSSIGGNLAENSGGVHCLKYGFTTNHVMGAEVVLPDGSVTHIGGGRAPDAPGYDLLGAFVGSEGTLGIATRITLRLCRVPEAVRTLLAAFEDTEGAGGAVSGIIGEGIIPAATEIRVAEDDDERALFWKARKAAFGAMGRISNDYYVQDGVIPRTELPAVLGKISELAGRYGLRVANVFHAGDGNLHPLVLYNNDTEGEGQKAEKLAGEIVFACLEHGGSLTGEHGIGEDKKKYMPRMFTDDDMNVMQLLRCAFDPHQLANPGKIFPTPRLCGQRPGPFHMHPLQKAGIVEQF